VNEQAPPEHEACACVTIVVHAFPHTPQLLALLVVSTHVEPQSVGVPAGHPETHPYVPPVAEHTGVPPVHAVLQPPHVAACERSVSQPSAGWPLQSAHPGAHAEAANAHAPAPHDVAPLTCGRPLQLVPQAPQLPVSLCSSTQAPLQSV